MYKNDAHSSFFRGNACLNNRQTTTKQTTMDFTIIIFLLRACMVQQQAANKCRTSTAVVTGAQGIRERHTEKSETKIRRRGSEKFNTAHNLCDKDSASGGVCVLLLYRQV